MHTELYNQNEIIKDKMRQKRLKRLCLRLKKFHFIRKLIFTIRLRSNLKRHIDFKKMNNYKVL